MKAKRKYPLFVWEEEFIELCYRSAGAPYHYAYRKGSLFAKIRMEGTLPVWSVDFLFRGRTQGENLAEHKTLAGVKRYVEREWIRLASEVGVMWEDIKP